MKSPSYLLYCTKGLEASCLTDRILATVSQSRPRHFDQLLLPLPDYDDLTGLTYSSCVPQT